MLAACRTIRLFRNPTRGGVATNLNEIAALAGVGIEIDQAAIPVSPIVPCGCAILGVDPLQVANEGKLLAVVPVDTADAALTAMQAHESGRQASILGRVVSKHPGRVALRTSLGSSRVGPMPLGEQLPRIC